MFIQKRVEYFWKFELVCPRICSDGPAWAPDELEKKINMEIKTSGIFSEDIIFASFEGVLILFNKFFYWCIAKEFKIVTRSNFLIQMLWYKLIPGY